MALLLLAAPVRASDESLAERIDAYLESCAAFGWSGVALVARDGEVLLRKGYGLADRATQRANDPDTLFEVASLTKVFTASAIMKLAETGKLTIDDPIALHLPGVPEEKHDITVRHLLTHMSGMSRQSGGQGADVAAAVRSNLDGPRARKAGVTMEYWNGGYALLAAIIENASGKSFEAFCREQVLGPAGMASSGFTGDDALPLDRQAMGYDGDRAVRFAAGHPYGAYDFRYKGMGGLVTSAEDLWRFAEALRAGRVLKPESLQRMLVPATEHQGLGWGLLVSARGTPRLVHGGAVKGFHTAFEILPTERAAIVILTNVEGVPPWKLQWNIQSMLFGEAPRYAMPPALAPMTDEAGRLLTGLGGVYRSADGTASLAVERSGRGLRLDAVGLSAMCGLSGVPPRASLHEAIQRAQAVLRCILEKDLGGILAELPEDAFWAKTWPQRLVSMVWPERERLLGPLKETRVIGATETANGMITVVLGLRHANGEAGAVWTFRGDGRLVGLEWNGPLVGLSLACMPIEGGRFACFDWKSDKTSPVITFDTDPSGRRVLRVSHPDQDAAEFRRE